MPPWAFSEEGVAEMHVPQLQHKHTKNYLSEKIMRPGIKFPITLKNVNVTYP
jgi:hypothetical protein